MDIGDIFLPVIGMLGATLALVLVLRMLAGLNIVVMQHERALLFIGGQFRRVLGPGTHLVLHPMRHIQRMDIRSQILNVPGQEVLTKEGLAFKLSALVQYRIERPEVAHLSTVSITEQLYADTQIALREFVGARDADEVMAGREQLNESLTRSLSASCATRGLVLERSGLKDLMLPSAVRHVLQQVIEARKGAEASLERARGETAVLRHLGNAARAIDDNPSLLALKALHTASDGKNTLVLNLPGRSGAPTGNDSPAS